MKLSSKQATSPCTSWQPEDLLPAAAESPAVSPQEIIDLFKGDLPMRPPSALGGSSTLQRKASAAFATWQPGDLLGEYTAAEAVVQRVVKIPGGAELPMARPKAGPVVQAMQAKLDQLLEEAHNTRAEAMRLEEEAQLRVQAMLHQGEQETQARFQQAYELGMAQARAEMAQATEAAQALLDELDAWRAQMLAQSEPIVIEMVKEIAHTLFGSGIDLAPQVLQDVLTKTLARTRTMGNLRVFVNPLDAAKIDPAWRDFQTAVSGQRIQIIPTEDIKSGGCYIEGDQGSVDARIDTRLEAVLGIFQEDTL